MEAPETSGAPSAASPSSTPTPATDAEFQAALNGEEVSSPPADGDQDPSAEPEGEKPDGEAEPDEKKASEDKPKDKTRKRIEKLLKKNADTQKQFAEFRQQAEREKVRLSVALKKVMGDLASFKERLSQYEDVDTAEAKLADYEARQKLRGELSEAEKRIQQEAEQHEAKARDDEARSFIRDAMEDALEDFPHLTRAQLEKKLKAFARENPDTPVEDVTDLCQKLARELDEEFERLYEPRILERHKPKLNAPKPISGKGTMGVPGSFSSIDEMAEDYERRRALRS